jgi:hypothetical protein
VLRLFSFSQRHREERPVATSSEPYRWMSRDSLEIFRLRVANEVRFTGTTDHEILLLTRVAGRMLTRGTRLRFVAAPDDPIPEAWRPIFFTAGPRVPGEEHNRNPYEATRQVIRDWLTVDDPAMRERVFGRLERAWRSKP